MYFKNKIIKNKKYRYVLKSIRLPDGRVKNLEKLYKNETKDELNKFFDEKEEKEHIKYSLNKFGIDYMFNEQEIIKIEKIKIDYKKIIKKLPKENIKDLLDRFTANFTYESNALEGNSLTLKDVSIVMFEKISIIPNIIIGSKIKTSSPEKVYDDMTNLLNWYNENRGKIPPVKLSALFHGKFEQIHPFEDGNGRVGRFLINLILIKNKYPPLIIRRSQRISYLKALENFDNGYYDTLERLILERFKETYKKFFEIYIKYA